MNPIHQETRWALQERGGFLCGRYCWDNANDDEPHVRTFRTRELARKAQQQMNSYSTSSQVVKVHLTIERI